MLTKIIDTHLHLIYRDRLRYPWLAGVAALNRDFAYETYAARGAALRRHRRPPHGGRRRPRRHRARNSKLSRTLRAGPRACCGAPSALVGQRMKIFRPFSSVSSQIHSSRGSAACCMSSPTIFSESATFRANIKRLAGTPRPFDLCVRPDQIDNAIALADLAPSVQFVLDHCGVPAIKDRAEHPWRERIAEIARRPNVAVKISGVVAYAEPGGLDRRRRSSLRRACDRKLRLGSGGLGQRLAGLHAHRVAFHLGRSGAGNHARRSASERERLFSANARRIWRLA